MRLRRKLIVGSAMLVLMSGTALADHDVRFGFSIGIPSAPVYVAPAPSYYPAPVYAPPPPRGYYDAPPAAYGVEPPQAYYAAPPPAYYDSAPGVSIYYGPSYRQYRERRDWHRDRHHRDDDDD